MAFQVRAWLTGSGSTYESALASGGAAGKNPIFLLKTKDETNPLETKPNIWEAPGFTGIQISLSCPEPSAIVLGFLGAGTLCFLRRHR